MTTMLYAPTREEWGTADACANRLTTPERPITAATIRKWAWRSRQPKDRLHGSIESKHGDGPRTGVTLYRFATVALVAALTEPGL